MNNGEGSRRCAPDFWLEIGPLWPNWGWIQHSENRAWGHCVVDVENILDEPFLNFDLIKNIVDSDSDESDLVVRV